MVTTPLDLKHNSIFCPGNGKLAVVRLYLPGNYKYVTSINIFGGF